MQWQRFAYYIESPPYRISKHQVKDRWKYILWKTTGKNAAMLGVFNSADEAKEVLGEARSTMERSRA